MKNKKTKTISKKDLSKFLKTSRLNQAILWLLDIPKEEWSDSMLSAYTKMEENNQNEIWLIDFFEQNLSEEINEFVVWNDNFLSNPTSK
jgi:hypothetical protein